MTKETKTTMERVVEEFRERFGKNYDVKSEPYDYVHEGLNYAVQWVEVKAFLLQALRSQAAEMLERVESRLAVGGGGEFYEGPGDFYRRGHDAARKEVIKIIREYL